MNFFSKSKHKATAPDAAPVSPPPFEAPPLDTPPSALEAAPPDPSPADAAPAGAPPPAPDPADAPRDAAFPDGLTMATPADAAPKKPRFARLKLFKPQLPSLSRKPPAEPAEPADPSAALADLRLGPSPDEQAKAARRAARRAERTRREEEWADRDYQARRDATIAGLPLVPIDPLPHFDSASEDEAAPAHPPHDPAPGSPHDGARALQGPYLPTYNDYPHEHHPAEHPPPGPQEVFPGQQRLPADAAPQRNPADDAHMAEMFGQQAYVGGPGYGGYGGRYPAQGVPQMHMQPPPPQQYQQTMRAPEAAPIGWGDVMSAPSQPMFAAPSHGYRGALDIDPMLADRIRRGRELARLAIAQEEQGNLGAAENGYMKALELLVPVSKELDVGSELDKDVRMKQKQKLHREAAAMMDRCEEIRLFLKANGPSVPKEMPSIPAMPHVKPAPRKRNGSTPKPPDHDFSSPSKSSTVELSRPKAAQPKVDAAPPTRPPPPPPPAFDGDSVDLLERIASRRNVLSAASAGIHAATGAPTETGTEKRTGGGLAKCFVCNAPAELKSKCSHTFCTKCGNQAANVFGACPNRNCSAPLSADGFDKLL